MYAIIRTGSKQYRVEPGQFLEIEKLEGDVGANIKFDQVLFWSEPAKADTDKSDVVIGKPLLPGASVQAQVVGVGRGKKIRIVKFKKRKGYRREMGHRQELTHVLVTGIDNGAGKKLILEDTEKTTLVKKFNTSLKPKGQGHTRKTLGSRKKMAEAKDGPKKAASKTETKATEKKATTKKAPSAKAAKAKK